MSHKKSMSNLLCVRSLVPVYTMKYSQNIDPLYNEQELDKQWRITYETVIRAKSSRGFNTRNGKVRRRSE